MIIYNILKEILNMFLEMSPYMMLGLGFVALFNLFISKEIIVKHIGKNNFWSVLKAALFGVPLPLCSCGVIPTAVYMSKNGASKGSVISFLISTPQTGIDSIIATYGMLGYIFAIFRPFAALVMGVAGGIAVKVFDKEISIPKNLDPKKISFNMYSQEKVADSCGSSDIATDKSLSFPQKIVKSLRYSLIEFVDDISVQFIIGVIISGLISYFVPNEFFSNLGINSGILGMLIMIAIGIPMYVCATASIPIAMTLMMKGFSPGVAFVFLVTGPATNAASISILTKVLGKKVLIIYLSVIIIGSVVFGYLLDFIFQTLNLNPLAYMQHNHIHDTTNNPYMLIISAVFLGFLSFSLFKKLLSKLKIRKTEMSDGIQKINIEGMTCNHCVMNVTKTLQNIEGIDKFNVSLTDNAAFLEGNFKMDVVLKAIDDIGYKASL